MAPSTDAMALPPAQRDFHSPNGRLRLRIESLDGWRSAQPQASLSQQLADGRWRTQWSRPLPHHHGPRRALLNDAAEVLLVDEWINVRSRHALVLLDPQGEVKLHATHDAVLAELRVSLDEMVRHARLGPWLAAEPTLSANQREAYIPAGGRVLHLDLRSGAFVLQ